MLVFDPRQRIRAEGGLAHEYLAPYHDLTDEPVAREKFDWSFNDADLPVDTWKIMMYEQLWEMYTIWAGNRKEELLTLSMNRYSEILDYHNVNGLEQQDVPAIDNGTQ